MAIGLGETPGGGNLSSNKADSNYTESSRTGCAFPLTPMRLAGS